VRVCFLSLDPQEASARTRAEAFFPALRAAGIEPELRRWPESAAGLSDLDEFEVVVLLRILVPRWALATLRRVARSLILDVDDAVWRRPSGRQPLRLRRRLLRTLPITDLVTCGSAYLRAALRTRHPRLRLLPPALALPERVPPLEERDAPLEVLWTGSSATLPYLEARAPALAAGLGAGATLVVLADRAPQLPGVAHRHEAWSLPAEAAALGRAQVGLYPLPRDAWSAGKCAYKVRLYMAHGLASLAVPWGGGDEALAEGGGLLFEDDAGLSRQLEGLCGDLALRQRLAREARATAAAQGSLDVRAPSLVRILREAAAIGARRGTGRDLGST
jgi:glycosyltransferase involved in cell wall biosynthesis